jgi:hypothetical protein
MPASCLKIRTFALLAVAAWAGASVAGAGVAGAAEPKPAEVQIPNGITVVLHLVNEPHELIMPADVIGVQPGGMLVLKAHDWAVDEAGVYEYTLTGKVAAKNLTADAFVTSDQIADLSFSKCHPAEPPASTPTSWLFDLCSWIRSH